MNIAAKVAELKPERAAGRVVNRVAADFGQVGKGIVASERVLGLKLADFVNNDKSRGIGWETVRSGKEDRIHRKGEARLREGRHGDPMNVRHFAKTSQWSRQDLRSTWRDFGKAVCVSCTALA